MDLRGARILVPGATGEIGAALAVRLHALGARTALAGRDREALTRVSAACEHAPARTFDAWDADSCAKTVDWAAAELGGLDGVVVCVGVAAFGPVEELATDQWQQQIDLNITGLMNAIGAFTPQLVEAAAERGVADLINTSSIAAQNIFPDFAVYSATKAYVSHLSRHLRVELGPKNVRVAAVEPGIVGTELQDHVTDRGALDWLESSKETIEWLTPQDVAETIGFIAMLPPRANLQQITIMPTAQAS
ncbi:SDR family oxidoreductase [Streptomyces adustus]|uniref:SDR family oxidoreductase n=1 Tax=Streptomyces adustus TaxID=1609272 RepID=UPI0035DFDF33